MNIKKKGLIYCPHGESKWDINSFITPHAIKLHKNEIRIYGGCRDGEGISRIRYVDVDEKNPSNILRIGSNPSLDIGNPGCFDDNGMILGDIIPVNNCLYMYYVGFQHVQKVKFHAFSGLAISKNGGESFERYSEVPVLDRTTTGRYGRCIHTVLFDEGIFKCWYAVIDDWRIINSVPYPVYNIWYTESEDGIHFKSEDNVLCVDTNEREYRIGRPKVYRTNNGYEMFYTRDLISKEYLAGYATSHDGIHWERHDELLNLNTPQLVFDSEMACYPVIYSSDKYKYIFYNGNGMGKTGVGFAEIVD